mmetsp:Transcript_75948/g.152599  ORF Transcript_75948/g.152599 Transcript_75948/m.152599 type:complete len:211 (+) Transcript_75948:1072-1704(+)
MLERVAAARVVQPHPFQGRPGEREDAPHVNPALVLWVKQHINARHRRPARRRRRHARVAALQEQEALWVDGGSAPRQFLHKHGHAGGGALLALHVQVQHRRRAPRLCFVAELPRGVVRGGAVHWCRVRDVHARRRQPVDLHLDTLAEKPRRPGLPALRRVPEHHGVDRDHSPIVHELHRTRPIVVIEVGKVSRERALVEAKINNTLCAAR